MSRAQDDANKFVTLRTRDVLRGRDEAFHAGTLAALDVVYLHDQQTIAGEIVGATDEKALLRHAVREEYHNLAKLRLTIRGVKRRTAKNRRAAGGAK